MSVCTICCSSEKKRIGEKNGFIVFRCVSCASVFAEEKLGKRDPFDYSDYYEESNLVVPEFVKTSLRGTIQTFEKYRLNNRLLDVGCGAGILLMTAKEAGWNAEGLEVSRTAVEHLLERGFSVKHGTLGTAGYPSDYFDVITLTEVIEHVNDPNEILREISRILRPNGLLWITTPNAGGLSMRVLGSAWSVVCPPEHLQLFSKHGLKQMLRQNGFEDCQFATHGINPFEIVRYLSKGENLEAGTSQVDAASENGFDRVNSSYALNGWFSGRKSKQRLKMLLNSAINMLRLGDTLKVWAILRK